MRFRRGVSRAQSAPQLPEILLEALNQLGDYAFILASGEVPVFATAGTEQLGILKNNKVQSPELLATVRVVRRTNESQVGNIEIPRGPIGEGKHDLTVKVIPLAGGALILVIVSDESEAQRIHDVRRDFVANISHELKTPIGALLLLSEAILGAKEDAIAVTNFATRMQSEAKRLTDLVQEIINLSRLQDSDPLQVARELGVQDLINSAIDQSQISADNRRIRMTSTHLQDVTILGDREQLIMAIHNLIENAINYSPEGTKVSVTTEIENGIIGISVTDQGIGIPDADLDRIFERFYRVDPARSRQTGGTGLGLSIVKHVALKHGGEVTVWSAQDVGSTFSLRIPIYLAPKETDK